MCYNNLHAFGLKNVETFFALVGKERFNFSMNRPFGAFLCYNNLTALTDSKAELFHRTPERTL